MESGTKTSRLTNPVTNDNSGYMVVFPDDMELPIICRAMDRAATTNQRIRTSNFVVSEETYSCPNCLYRTEPLQHQCIGCFGQRQREDDGIEDE